ncbi:hypothetical protein LCGC14_0615450 [marine sediment metagenome]|uniref:Uncharacterized protein n=1 Tax=marine sediment metagenome TaxID=412755 RepID=A0A0F9R6K4_9ZZZZ|nr:hypothetical protein [bacterium]
MKHEHKEHEHKIKLCKKCDKVFCEEEVCNVEWASNIWTVTNTPGSGTITVDGTYDDPTFGHTDTSITSQHC